MQGDCINNRCIVVTTIRHIHEFSFFNFDLRGGVSKDIKSASSRFDLFNVPAYATSGALIYVAILMLGGMEKLDWTDTTELVPSLIMIVMIPLTFSIANGIALGFISYVVIKAFVGEIKSVSSGAWFLFAND